MILNSFCARTKLLMQDNVKRKQIVPDQTALWDYLFGFFKSLYSSTA